MSVDKYPSIFSCQMEDIVYIKCNNYYFSLFIAANNFCLFLVIRCYSLNQDEMESFLELLSNCVETDGSTAAVTELSRYLVSNRLRLKNRNHLLVIKRNQMKHYTCALLSWRVPLFYKYMHFGRYVGPLYNLLTGG